MSDPTVLFRPAVPADLHAICVLGQDVNALHHVAAPRFFSAPSAPERDADYWGASLEGAGNAAFVAERNGRVVGFITARMADNQGTLVPPMRYASIGSVCVAASERGRGIGRRLLTLVEEWAVAEGAEDVRLMVWRFNDGAKRLYEELGYEVRSMAMGKVLRDA